MNKEQKGRKPDFSGDGVAVWVNQTKDKKPYLSIKILNGINVNAFKYEPKEKKVEFVNADSLL